MTRQGIRRVRWYMGNSIDNSICDGIDNGRGLTTGKNGTRESKIENDMTGNTESQTA